MGELEAAIGIEQLKKLKNIISKFQKLSHRLIKGLSKLNGLKVPKINKHFTHSFYAFPMVLDLKELKVNRKKIVDALKAEGVPLGEGYLNIHTLPIFKKKIAYGTKNFPWKLNNLNKSYKHKKCLIAEELHNKSYFALGIASYDLSIKDIDSIIKAFEKVWKSFKFK
tara:strand:- start:198 stop:698 length:501 start_codon:yes stop_codon:yes gene_type:complete